MTTQQMVQVSNLSVHKNGKAICSLPQLDVAAGQIHGIAGANGSGKTTCLRVLAGLEMELDGSCEIACAPRDRVYVHQSPYLFRGTVWSNVAYGLAARGVHKAEQRNQAIKCLQQLEVADLADRMTTGLSGGEVRRIALARAAVLRPALLLLDEPFAELDDRGVELVANLIRTLSETTVVITSPVSLPSSLVSSVTELCSAK